MKQLSPAVNQMKLKSGGVQRTWHSLWDEMFSISGAFDPNTDDVDIEAFRPDVSRASNDNGKLETLETRKNDE